MNTKPTLNHGGSSPDNPVLVGMAIKLRLAKTGASETLRQCWVVADGNVFQKLTGVAVETAYEIEVDLTAGADLKSGFPAVENIIIFTTSEHRKVKASIWCATLPATMITLNGYDGSDFSEPLIYPLYDPEQGVGG